MHQQESVHVPRYPEQEPVPDRDHLPRALGEHFCRFTYHRDAQIKNIVNCLRIFFLIFVLNFWFLRKLLKFR